MTALVFATAEEAAPFLERYARGRFEELTEGDVLMDDRILVTITGSGKIKATLRTERLLRAHRPGSVLHAGLCVALRAENPVGSVIAMKQVLEGDRIEVSVPSYPRIPLADLEGDNPAGTLLTQDHPLQGRDEQAYWQRVADHQDSTGYAIAYVTATHGIPVSIVKAVGGHAGEQAVDVRAARRRAASALADYLTGRFA